MNGRQRLQTELGHYISRIDLESVEMKQLIPILTMGLVLGMSSAGLARNYDGRCLYLDREKSENKFHSCLVTPTQTQLQLTFKSNKFQDGNQVIAGTGISQIASGNYAKRLLTDTGSIIGSILLAPIGIASRLFNKDFQQYVLDYTLRGQRTATVVRVDREDAPEFQQELRTLARNMLIRFEDPKDSTVIDVGPDIE